MNLNTLTFNNNTNINNTEEYDNNNYNAYLPNNKIPNKNISNKTSSQPHILPFVDQFSNKPITKKYINNSLWGLDHTKYEKNNKKYSPIVFILIF